MTKSMKLTIPALTALAIATVSLVRSDPPKINWPQPTRADPFAAALARLRARTGSPAPKLMFQLFSDDSVHRLSEFRRPVLVNVWAIGCGPCWKELPRLRDLQELQGDRIAVVALTSSDPVRVREVAAKRNVLLPPLSGYTNRVSWQRPLTSPLTRLIDGWIPDMGWPVAVLIDSEGKVQAVRLGVEGIEELIATLPV